MLRECFRVLRSGGRIAGYVIHTPDALGVADATRAAELGPDDVWAPAAPEDLARLAGFSDVVRTDVSDQYRATVEEMLQAAGRWEVELRAEQGDEEYEAGRTRGQSMQAGIREGLLLRPLLIGVKR